MKFWAIRLFFQLTHVRVTVTGVDDDRRIITMTLGFGERAPSSKFSVRRVDVVESLSLETSIFCG